MDDRLKQIYKLNMEEKCNMYPELPDVLPAVRRIIAIGDIHGDYRMAVKSLRLAKVIDKKLNWIGGDTIVVQLGDQIDSCRETPCNVKRNGIDKAEDIKILKFFTKLHNKALNDGGAVYSIMGNHELMNVVGRMDYVSYENVREFEGKLVNGKVIDDGMTARKLMFKPGNEIAEFMACTRKLALVIGSNLFVHAGILPEISRKYNISDMNQLLSLYLMDSIEHRELINYADLLGPEILNNISNTNENVGEYYHTSPLWNRKYSKISSYVDSELKCNEILSPLKEVYNVNNLLVGHTPQLDKGINSICNNRIHFVDVGVSRAFNMFRQKGGSKRIQVLEILNDNTFNVLK